MLFKLNQELTKGAWPRVVNNAVASGEVRKTLVGLVSFWKGQAPKAEETQSAPTLGSGDPAQDGILPSAEECQGPSPLDGVGC